MIPHSKPSVTDDDAERVARVVRSGRLAQGPEVAAFERELAARLGVQDAAAVASGTAALELALGALGVGAGDEVLIPTYVCDALHHAVRRAGATPVLVDADPATHSLSAKDALARRTRRTRAVIVPHAFGLAADLQSNAGTGYLTQARLGSVPPQTSGSAMGKMALVGGAQESVLVRAIEDFKRRRVEFRLWLRMTYGDAIGRPLGTFMVPARSSSTGAPLARGQLARLDTFVARRRALAARYRALLAGAPARLPAEHGPRHVYHRFVLGLDRDPAAVLEALAARGVAARRPVFRPAHRALGLGGYPEADRLWAESLSIPCYPALTDDEAEHVARALRTVLT